MSDIQGENKETINYNNDVTNIDETYHAILDLIDLKSTLESCSEQYITIKFGDGQAVLVCRANIVFVVPELHLV